MWKKIMNEAAIRPGGREYKPYGHILILAGGAGSGKGFAYDMAIDFDGKKFDVDEMKKRVMKLRTGSKLDQKFFAQTSRHLKDLDMKDGEDVSLLHKFCSDEGLDEKMQNSLFSDVKDRAEKPNIIFDKTLKSEKALAQVCSWAKMGGYDPRNIHIVWILNDFDKATSQNQQRDRKVSASIMNVTHEGVSRHFKEMLSTADSLTDTIDGSPMLNGDIWVFFNNSGVDNFVKHSGLAAKHTKDGHEIGGVMDTINAVRIKKHGEPIADFDTIMDMKVKEFDENGNLVSRDKVTVRDKIEGYVPQPTKDIWKKIDDEGEGEDEGV